MIDSLPDVSAQIQECYRIWAEFHPGKEKKLSTGFESSGSSENSPDFNREPERSSLFANYSVVSVADGAVQRDLEEWTEVAARNIEQAQTLLPEDPLRGRILSNARLLSTLCEDILFDPESFRGVRDNGGNLQAAAIVGDMSDHLYLYDIITAPWNVVRTSPKSVRDAGKTLMLELVKESISSGYEGRIMLNALPGAISFYEEAGFVFTGEGSQGAPEMELTPLAAREFFRRYNP